jgi:SAM-dependent methyltransferase
MIRCPRCLLVHPGQPETCPGCSFEPTKIGGFTAWAPEVALNGTGFRPEYFAQLAELESGNFWFRARNALIGWAVGTYFPHAGDYLELGCGTGYVLEGISRRFPRLRLCASELLIEGLPFAAARVPTARLVQLDARELPWIDAFDLVGAFDVLEHVDRDDRVLLGIREALRPGGGVILTVPQHPALWSEADRYACHVRRYTRSELQDKLTAAGFRIVRSTSFVSLLLPLMAASRLRTRSDETYDPMAELRISPVINRLLEGILALERGAIRMGLSLPMGGSRLVVAVRDDSHPTRR